MNKCKECNHQFSVEYEVICPVCGYDNTKWISRYNSLFYIDDVVSKCDCCKRESAPDEIHYFISTPSDFGLVLCSYCILMLNYRLNDFHKEHEE